MGPATSRTSITQGPQLGQVFWSSPKGGNGNLRIMFLLAIAAATRRILIANAYFVPDETTVDMLVAARRRGVDVEIIVPGPILDAQVVRRASRSMWGPMLEAGVKIYEYQPTMYHTKVMVVDDIWVSVGSTNFDDRSFRLNQEASLNVYDSGFGAAQAETFVKDRAKSQRNDAGDVATPLAGRASRGASGGTVADPALRAQVRQRGARRRPGHIMEGK